MTLSHHVAVITSDEQALIVASDLAEDFRRDSALRDRERRLPLPELDVFSRSGLWGISVPKAFGGAGVSNVTLAKVTALIAQADASLGQIPQNHFYALEVLRVNGSPAQQKRLYAEVLAGRRFGNRSEEHTSELQSRLHLVCRLLLEKKKNNKQNKNNKTNKNNISNITCV